jgi:hypothetical protein
MSHHASLDVVSLHYFHICQYSHNDFNDCWGAGFF